MGSPSGIKLKSKIYEFMAHRKLHLRAYPTVREIVEQFRHEISGPSHAYHYIMQLVKDGKIKWQKRKQCTKCKGHGFIEGRARA